MYNNLKQFHLRDYDDAIKTVYRFCSKNPKILFWGQFGEIKSPGVSDIDLLIVTTDENYQESILEVELLIKSSDAMAYMFWHPPLIIPKSLLSHLPFLHTLHGLSFDSEEPQLVKLTKQSKSFMNRLWTLFILPIAIHRIDTGCNEDFRGLLLLLKNLHCSIDNLIEDVAERIWINKSYDIRILALEEKITREDLLQSYEEAVLRLCALISKERTTQNMVPPVSIHPKLCLMEGSKVQYKYTNSILNITLCSDDMSIFKDLKRQSSKNLVLDDFISHSIEAHKVCQKNRYLYPFFSPMGFQFYRSDLRYIAKMLYCSIIHRK